VKLTGILSASGIEEGDEAPYGRVVSPLVQTRSTSTISASGWTRAIDGPLNRLVEEHAEAEPDPDRNPYGNAVRHVREPLPVETAQRNDPGSPGTGGWRARRPPTVRRSRPRTGCHPRHDAKLGLPGSVMARRAPFIHEHLWATPYAETRLHRRPVSEPREPGEDGVHVWQRQGRSIDGVPLVLWPVLGVHHLPRPEQWPSCRSRRSTGAGAGRLLDRNPGDGRPGPAASCS